MTKQEKTTQPAEEIFAVVKTGGKQYLVKEGDVLEVEKIEANQGDTIKLEEVLLVSAKDNLQIGTPNLESANVEAEVLEQGKGKKITVLRFRAKSNYKRKYGHRQPFTKIKVTKINA